MRRQLFFLVAACSIVGLVQVPSGAQTKTGKTASAWTCGGSSPSHAIPVGDAPNHIYVVQQTKCTATKGEVGGVKEQEGTATEFAEITGDTAKGHGIFVETLANGDKINVAYEFEGVSKNGNFQSGSNKWTFVSGTGMMQGAKGSGTCTAKGSPDGGVTFECTGTHTLAK